MSDFVKDPNDIIYLGWDWSADCDLQATAIVAAVIVVPTGITVSGQRIDDNIVSGLFAGGTNGKTYTLTCRVTFANGEVLNDANPLVVKTL